VQQGGYSQYTQAEMQLKQEEWAHHQASLIVDLKKAVADLKEIKASRG
jgi:hypothetical protein